MNSYHKNRLLKLADRLDDVDPVHFDMGTWAQSAHPCETAGCALGYATTIPSFRRAGLRLRLDDDTLLPTYRTAQGRVHFGTMAGEAFFGLSYDESVDLFLPDSYSALSSSRIRPTTVAKRIRKLVEAHS